MLDTVFHTHQMFDPVVIRRRRAKATPKKRVQATLTDSFVHLHNQPKPGTLLFTSGDTRMLLACPGCGEISSLPLCGEDGRKKWKFTGSREKPTLRPSIHHDVAACGWHGHLTKGVFEE